ncbi:type-F conjugative transfer system pilin assembly protein TrbC [Novosphingobium album (ex Liu et al. 2023)]|uniref:Type-F conjugative transfer system pilin assembly protein TrbC n=1 Tax=Novosphingobium album (ex Liu et al. 2023) TaxID=3031130 RepID=A0ABT5WQC6_9SPHN|nr:type-F conjugative transfer system pilin assembly protein TrbC [Novosphingobium album (ex Liu et al. 2023)]MDE8652247.1 type-F conjugative transfer system pilin assembly protein TrbC [Novosphingobium album (ex Liu et al. 2023)]
MAGAAAQTSEAELDLEAIRARAKVETSEADALAASARARAEALLRQANDSAAAAQAHGKRYTEQAARSARREGEDVFDFDKMVADAGTVASEGLGEAPRFIAFASLSMPPAALRTMADDVARAGGVVVLRGLPEGSATTLTAALSKIAQDGGTLDAVGIDPRLFRAFGIEAVPTYVVTGSDFDLCDGFDCRTQVPPHDRMSGNVSVSYALETFAQGGGPGALIASQHLARLGRSAP